mgnify:CR=1 FL=1
MGGTDALVLTVHRSCNERANRLVDAEVVRCRHLQFARARLGVTERRRPVSYKYRTTGTVIHTDPGLDGLVGAPVQMTLGATTPSVRFIEREFIGRDGAPTVTSEHRGAGLVDAVGDGLVYVSSDDAPCRHDPWAWRRFTAKIGIGVLAVIASSTDLLDDGTPVAHVLTDDVRRKLWTDLATMAFGAATPDRYGIGAEPFKTSQGDRLRAEHVIGIGPVEVGTAVAIRLFDFLAYRIIVEGGAPTKEVEMRMPLPAGRGVSISQ